MAISVDLDTRLDKGYKELSAAEVLDAPIAALAGISENGAAKLTEALGIKTVRELGSNKYFRFAAALVDLDEGGK